MAIPQESIGNAVLQPDAELCRREFLSWTRFREWRDVHRQLLLQLKDLKLQFNREPADYEALHKALLSGLPDQVGLRQETGDYMGLRGRHFHLFPGSALQRRKPQWLVVAELVGNFQTLRSNGRSRPASVDRVGG